MSNEKTVVINNPHFGEVEIGDSKKPDFYPQIKFKKWDNECNLSVRLSVDKDGTYKQINNNVEWENTNKTIKTKFYPKTDDDPEKNEYEFEVIFNEKPDSNIVNFSINTKDLDFFYQPELTEEEKELVELDDRSKVSKCYRPENVIGSYVVYHSTKMDYILGETNYKTGKAFHIYRPFVTDSEDNKIWCDLNIDDSDSNDTTGLLTITIPQDFLDNAVYPIILDPTFGNTHAGSSSTVIWTNNAIVCKGAPATSGNVDKMTAYGQKGVSASIFKGVLWNFSAKTVVTNGVGGTVNTLASYSWLNMNYSTKPAIIASTNYYAGFVVNQTAYMKYDTGAANTGGYVVNNYVSPTTLDSLFNNTRRYSIYATYSAAVVPPPLSPRKLYYRKTSTIGISLYTSRNAQSGGTTMENYLNLYTNGVPVYAEMSSNLSHTKATSLRVRKGGTTYTVLSSYAGV